jgi:hypothetical protein
MDNEGQVRELLLKEYVESGHAARQHEQLTRASVSVFLPILLAPAIEATIKVQDAQVIKLYTLGRNATRRSHTVSNKTAFLALFVFSATFFLVSAVVYFIHIICTVHCGGV